MSPNMESTRRLRIRHTTRYQYDRLVERSAHMLHLRPIHDWKQAVIDYRLTVDPSPRIVEYEDVFGNWVARFELTQPYSQLSITAESFVELLDVDPFEFAKLPIRPSFPLVWMPWERTMLASYLTPVELPDTQLREITDYAMGFVLRNEGDLMESLIDINLTLFREYAYVPGSTTNDTTPYETMISRRGVCQDFAGLFICMARLMGIPARYVCGYLHTGNTGASRAGSDATHAWVQLYIPNVGWKGFDPTNGVLTQLDHVRVSYGRHFRDATPTAGTLYTGANESMTIDVEVSEASRTAAPSHAS